MRKTIFPVLALLSFALIIGSCERKPTQTISFAFYNVENLFDTIDDPRINDDSYLPGSKIPWNTGRYQHKLDNLAKVITALDSNSFPALFGLCEVENIDVLRDLVNHPNLKPANYQILHQNSPDERGIDVAMLYQSKHYTPIETDFIRLTFPFDPNNKTRDILYSKGIVGKQDTLHIFINHWVSRWGGQEETDPSRRFIGDKLKQLSDSIMRIQPRANIIIAGDLNDNPTDASIAQNLGALPVSETLTGSTLYNLSHMIYRDGEGTLYYKDWDMFDQIIVSTALLQGENGVRMLSEKQTVVKHEWMLYQPKEGPARPNRTASGKYFGGYSDHLPVMIKMEVK